MTSRVRIQFVDQRSSLESKQKLCQCKIPARDQNKPDRNLDVLFDLAMDVIIWGIIHFSNPALFMYHLSLESRFGYSQTTHQSHRFPFLTFFSILMCPGTLALAAGDPLLNTMPSHILGIQNIPYSALASHPPHPER